MPHPFESEPVYARPFLMIGAVLRTFFELFVPVIIALIIIFGIIYVVFTRIAAFFRYKVEIGGSGEIIVKRKMKNSQRQEDQLEGKADTGYPASSIPADGSVDTADLRKRLEIELEILGEMVVARRERLEALGKTELRDEVSSLEGLEKSGVR